MISSLATYAVPRLGPLLVLLLAVSFWCGHSSDVPAETAAQCLSQDCATQTERDVPSHNDSEDDSECMCVCHTPTIRGISFNATSLMTARHAFIEFPDFPYPSPAATIYHPPKA